jgi:predicted O-linked N-acetylglucosamine transferase (SPINDLY family)
MKRHKKTEALFPPKAAGPNLLQSAVQHLQSGRLTEAQAAYRQLLTFEPQNVIGLHHLGIVEHQLGRSDEAIRLLRKSLAIKPNYAQAYADLGVILMQLQRDDEAIEVCRKAIALDPAFAAAHSNLGDLMLRRGDYRAAESAYGKAVSLQSGFPAALIGRAESLIALGRLDEAQQACRKAMRLAPQMAEVHGVHGLILHREGLHAEAAAAYQEALRINPNLALIHTRLANVFRAEGKLEEALNANACAIQADADCVEAYCNQAITLQTLGRFEEALRAYSEALARNPDFAFGLANQGLLLHHLGRSEEAIAVLRRAVELAPEAGFTYVYLGSVLKDRKRYVEACDVYRAMLNACENPPPDGFYDYCNLRRQICDWDGLEDDEKRAVDAIKKSGERMPPFSALAMACAPEDHLALARGWASGFKMTGSAQIPSLHSRRKATSNDRIRLGYLSSDFFEHATASLIVELIERHDRNRFEVFAYCHSPDDASPLRRRLMNAFDCFRPIGECSHTEAAKCIVDDEIDILIDLKGYTRDARTMILAQRPAPIQASYLGYPTTMGAPFIDYIIADPIVAPAEHQPFFDEKIVHLPDCYQPNDRHREVSQVMRTRADRGLPEDGFVFCSFNNAYKITAPVFAIWMRLLGQVPASVLWLLDANPLAKENLQREASARGVDPGRIIFAPKLPLAEHLGRYALADLFLDNLPVNAHTTASEALWSGLPVVTCLGEIFVGRVAASLLKACGLPELVTHSLEDYEALALRLARDGSDLNALKQKLMRARETSPLFDTERYARNLEKAFMHMIDIERSGSVPEAFGLLA